MSLQTETVEQNDWELLVWERVKNLRFGTVQLTIHQGRVTQIEATEKIRIEDPDDGGKSGHQKKNNQYAQ